MLVIIRFVLSFIKVLKKWRLLSRHPAQDEDFFLKTKDNLSMSSRLVNTVTKTMVSDYGPVFPQQINLPLI